MNERARVALRCDAGGTLGVGHVMRCVALGEELSARGHEVVVWGDLGGIDWLSQLVAAHGYDIVAAPSDPRAAAAAADELGLDAVVLDGYHLDPDLGSALCGDSRRVLAMVDYDFGVRQRADIYVDQNLGAMPHPQLPTDAVALNGIDYALFRDSVLRRRRARPLTGEPIPRVVAMFGGTDPYGAAPIVISALLATGAPMHADVVVSRPEIAAAVRCLRTGVGQRVRVLAPTPDFGAVAADADIVVSASGSSVWELLCMGIPAAAVCVVDNQEEGYRLALEHDVVLGLGLLHRFDPDGATAALATLLTDRDGRDRRAALGQDLVDGRGRVRVADALL